MTTSRRASLLVAARFAQREVRRHPWRHLLVVALIFVPVFGALAAFSAVATGQDVGRRSDSFRSDSNGTLTLTIDQVPELGLPPGSSIEASWTGGDWLVTDRGRADGQGPELEGTEVTEAPEGSIASSQFVVLDGRLPRTGDEVFLTEPLADAGGWTVGGEVESARSGRTFVVVGTGVTGGSIDERNAVVGPVSESYWTTDLAGIETIAMGPERYQISTRAQQQVRATPQPQWKGFEDGEYRWRGASSSDGRLGPSLLLGAAAVCAVVAVVASAAFAIASRRQLRNVGLLSTLGADPATIRWAMVLQGAIPGVLAGAGAVLAGMAAVFIINGQGWVEQGTDVYGSRALLSIGGAAAAVALGLASGVGAAWQPARTASRIPTLAALAGRRPVGPVPSRVPMAGAALWAAGSTLLVIGYGADQGGLARELTPFLLILGVAAFALGGVGLAPALVALLDPLARHTRGTVRMSLRGLARHRTQSAATVAAIAVALALPVGLLTARSALEVRDRSVVGAQLASSSIPYASSGSILRSAPIPAQVMIEGSLRSERADQAIDDVRRILGPEATVVRTIPIVDQTGGWTKIAIVDEDVAPRILAPSVATAIVEGKAVSLGPSPGSTPRAPTLLKITAAGDQADFDVVDAAQGDFSYLPGSTAEYVAGSKAMGEVGAQRPPDSVAVVRSDPLTGAELRRVEQLSGNRSEGLTTQPTLDQIRAAAAAGSTGAPAPQIDAIESDVSITAVVVEDLLPQRQQPSTSDVRWQRILVAVAVVAGALALLVLTITLSLRSVDGQGDQRAAFAAGVSPGRLRNQRALEGVVLALLGALVALPLGWIPVMAARLGTDTNLRSDFILPGWQIIPILLAPAVLAAIVWTLFPWLGATVRSARRRGPHDQLLSGW